LPSIRTQKTSISSEVKHKVHERDNGCCLLCGRPQAWNLSNAHIIPRSSGGLGIEENIITLCQECHYHYDFGNERKMLYDFFVEYQKKTYPNWTREDMIFKKGQK